MKTPRFWMLSYDIADPRRLRRVAKAALRHGERVQKSLYQCTLSAEQFKIFRSELQRLHHPEEDRLMLRPVCRHCREQTRTQGMGGHPERLEPFWII